jgi:predicted nucleotide-binding protein (sugar kinase/HSP70/actin superfamily)
VRSPHESAVAESCFPVKLAFGHLVDVVRKDVDLLFLPSMMTRERAAEGQPHNHYCPLIPATPHLLMQNLPADLAMPRIVNRALHFHDAHARRTELRALAAALTGASSRAADAATEAGWSALERFQHAVRARGLEVLESLADGLPGVVVVGRPYTSNDTGSNLDLPYKLRRLGVLPMPMDSLPLERVSVPDRYDDMYWRSGQDIMRAAVLVRDTPRLQAIYLTNFNCGPDAFLLTYFRETLNGKPFLELEVDDHTADAGMITRCEAFFDSLNLRRAS